MSRLPRAGTAGKMVGLRATDAERERWEAAAKDRAMSLSEWLRFLANEEANWIGTAGPDRRTIARRKRKRARSGR